MENEVMAIPGKYQTYVNQFIASLDIKENTKKSYRHAMKVFIKWIEENNISNPTSGSFLLYAKKSGRDSPGVMI